MYIIQLNARIAIRNIEIFKRIMKATDLLVGDIIYRPDCYDKVVEIRLNGIIGQDSNRGLIPFDEIRPIKITPEILENNGFVTENGEFVFDFYDGRVIIYNRFDYNLRIVENYKTILDIKEYREIRVHELQHALRLCGIDKEIIL